MECGMLKLPTELRLQILNYLIEEEEFLLIKTPALATIPVKPTQPAISLVNRQLRGEALSLFYRRNVFIFKLFDNSDVTLMSKFLNLIGDFNASRLRRLAFCGWAQMGFGHMRCRWWWRVDIDLRNKTVEWDRKVTWDEERRLVQSFRDSFAHIAQNKHDGCWSVDELVKLMRCFTATCAAY